MAQDVEEQAELFQAPTSYPLVACSPSPIVSPATTMATLPRAASKSPTSSKFLSRPTTDFDSGQNASNAWAEHLERTESIHGSLSDDENEDQVTKEKGKSARVLYDFEGKPEFRELTLVAGDELLIIKELHEGWSLANCSGEIGLVPKSYYIVSHCKVHVNTLVLIRTSTPQSSSHRHRRSRTTPDSELS